MLEVDFDFRFLVFPQCVKTADAMPLADLEIEAPSGVHMCIRICIFRGVDAPWTKHGNARSGTWSPTKLDHAHSRSRFTRFGYV